MGCWEVREGGEDDRLGLRPPQNSPHNMAWEWPPRWRGLGLTLKAPGHPPVQRADLPFPQEKKCTQRRPAMRASLLPIRPLHRTARSSGSSPLHPQVKTVVRSPRNERVTGSSSPPAAACGTHCDPEEAESSQGRVRAQGPQDSPCIAPARGPSSSHSLAAPHPLPALPPLRPVAILVHTSTSQHPGACLVLSPPSRVPAAEAAGAAWVPCSAGSGEPPGPGPWA